MSNVLSESYKKKTLLALDPNTPHNMLKKLSVSKITDIRSSVAANPRTSPDILTVLSNDKEWSVRFHVARNRNCPENIRLMIQVEDLLDL